MAIEGRSDAKQGGRIRLGMVGGGQGAFIGAVHRLAARMDDQYDFVAGALSSTPARSQRFGRGARPRARPHLYRLSRDGEGGRRRARTASRRSSIVTPNNVHVPAAKAFIEAGIHVICDKPLAIIPEGGEGARRPARKKKRRHLRPHPQLFRLSDDPPGARDGGEGRAWRRSASSRREYPQDWLTEPISRRPARSRRPGAPIPSSRAGGCHRRYRHPRLSARLSFVSGLTLDRARRRPHDLRQGPQGRRQCQRDAALQERRARHAVGEPGGARQ